MKKIISTFFAIIIVLSLFTFITGAEFIRDKDGRGHFVNSDGSYATGLKYVTFNEGGSGEFSRMCIFDESGTFNGYYTGFTSSSKGRRFYLDGNRAFGWYNIRKSWYYFDKYGYALTNSSKISGFTYIFDEKGVWTGKYAKAGKRPDDFSVEFSFCYGKYMNTSEKIISKSQDEGPPAEAKLEVSGAVLQIFWSQFIADGIDKFDQNINYDYTYAAKVFDDGEYGQSEPTEDFEITVKYNGESHKINGTYDLLQCINDDETAAAIWNYKTMLTNYCINTKQYKALPEPLWLPE